MQTTDTSQDILSDIGQPPPVASIGKRVAAALIDGAILLVIFVVLGNFFGERYSTTTTTTTNTSDSSLTTHDFTTSTGFHLTGIPALVY
ncbi:MAG TPA: RDD family protein, partial [Puia sp.]|nr:RDD family protein [Puia sp.]